MKYYILFIVFFFCSSCVTTKVFNDLEVRYYEMKTQSNALKNSKDSIQKSWVKLNEKWNETKSYLKRSRDSINSGLNDIKILQGEYFLLKENSDQRNRTSISIRSSK
jgi:chemotaxis protein MotB